VEPSKVLVASEELDAAPHHAAGYRLTEVAADGLELDRAFDGDDEVDLVGGVAVEGCSMLVAQLLGDDVRNGPAQDWQAEVLRGSHGCGGRVGVVWVSGDSVEVEAEYAVRLGAPGGLGDVGGELVEVDLGKPTVWVAEQLDLKGPEDVRGGP
jgi:hypothetical protein